MVKMMRWEMKRKPRFVLDDDPVTAVFTPDFCNDVTAAAWGV